MDTRRREMDGDESGEGAVPRVRQVCRATVDQVRARPLLLLGVLIAGGLVGSATGALDHPVLAYLGNNPGNQG
jgi:hypothetical protein